MAGGSVGATDVELVSFGATEIATISIGDTIVWEAFSFVPSGMTKTGTQNLTTSWAKLLGWTAQSGSTVVDDALQVIGDNDSATITVSLPYTGSFSYPRTARVLLNGVVVATGPSVSTSSGTLTANATGVAVEDGDDVTVEVMVSSFANGSISAGGTVTVT